MDPALNMAKTLLLKISQPLDTRLAGIKLVLAASSLRAGYHYWKMLCKLPREKTNQLFYIAVKPENNDHLGKRSPLV